jgi:hypothetical protein
MSCDDARLARVGMGEAVRTGCFIFEKIINRMLLLPFVFGTALGRLQWSPSGGIQPICIFHHLWPAIL